MNTAEEMLVAFFQSPDGDALGREGDHDNLSPAATAIRAMKRLDASLPRAELEAARTALEKINAIRNSIVGIQGFNFSEHAYPLVAALDEVGLVGLPYPEARANLGTLIEQRDEAQKQCAAVLGACWKCKGAGFYMRTPGCSRCDDSGDDHECDDREERTECEICRWVRAALSGQPAPQYISVETVAKVVAHLRLSVALLSQARLTTSANVVEARDNATMALDLLAKVVA